MKLKCKTEAMELIKITNVTVGDKMGFFDNVKDSMIIE